MTTITIDRATVEQALEALEADCGGRCNAEYNPCWQREVAETLRAALARQAEPVAVDAAYQRWLEDTHAPALRRMDSQGAFAAGWQAALAQQAEPVQRSQDWHAGVLEGHLRERERWLAQQAEPVAVAERERIAAQWDGCVTHRLDTFGPVDIGASIRAGELVGPAQQAEPVQEPETVDQRVVPLVESALQAVAEKIGDQCAVWYGIGARDVEEVLREAVRHGLVHGALAEPVEPVRLQCVTCGTVYADGVPPQVPVQAEPLISQCGETCERAKLCATCAQALAQQAEPVAPVAQCSFPACQATGGCVGACTRAALAQQAEPVQEPAAKVELMMTGGNAGLATRIVEIDHHLRDRLRPGQLLYTAPPKRQPLTDEQISDLWCEVSNTDFVTADTHVFARAVESKLQEKNT